MANSLVQNLAKRAFLSLADLTEVRLWSGKGAEPNALGLEVVELLSSEIVADDSIDYKSLTPKGFNASIATEARKGIQRLATDAEINNKEEVGLLNSADQIPMQAQWNKDWFEKEGIPNNVKADSFTTPHAMKFDVNFFNTIASTTSVSISKPLPAGYRFKGIYFTWMCGIVGDSGLSRTLTNGTGVLRRTGGIVSYSIFSLIGGSDLDLRLSADGREISVYAPNTLAAYGVELSISFNAILESF